MCFTNVKQHLSRTVATKRHALESSSLCHSTGTHASVLKGKNQVDDDDDSVSNMTDSSKEIKGKEIKSKLTNDALEKSNMQSDGDNLNGNSSM